MQTTTQTNGTAATTTYSGDIKIPIGCTFSAGGTSAQTTTSQVTANVVNKLSFVMRGNLLVALVEYTALNGVKYSSEISLGLVTQTGGFIPFTDGYLDGKDIVVGSPITTISPTNAPGKRHSTGEPGAMSSSGATQQAEILAGYWVTVGSVNGVVVCVSVDPVYQLVTVNFRVYSNPYKNPGGGYYEY